MIIQRAVEDEFDQWLGRARYERQPASGPARRNVFRPKRVQTAERELRIEMPQVREAAPFVSRFFYRHYSKRLLRTEPLKTLIVGAFVRGLSTRDVESLFEQAGLGGTSKSTVSRVRAELHERFEAFKRRDLYEVKLVVLFLDAIFLPVRPTGPKEGVICAWGITEDGHRALVSVRLGMRESKDDWLELSRDLAARGMPAPRMVVSDGAPGLMNAIEKIWPRADRQRCAAHRIRNVQARLPKGEQDRVGVTPICVWHPQSRSLVTGPSLARATDWVLATLRLAKRLLDDHRQRRRSRPNRAVHQALARPPNHDDRSGLGRWSSVLVRLTRRV